MCISRAPPYLVGSAPQSCSSRCFGRGGAEAAPGAGSRLLPPAAQPPAAPAAARSPAHAEAGGRAQSLPPRRSKVSSAPRSGRRRSTPRRLRRRLVADGQVAAGAAVGRADRAEGRRRRRALDGEAADRSAHRRGPRAGVRGHRRALHARSRRWDDDLDRADRPTDARRSSHAAAGSSPPRRRGHGASRGRRREGLEQGDRRASRSARPSTATCSTCRSTEGTSRALDLKTGNDAVEPAGRCLADRAAGLRQSRLPRLRLEALLCPRGADRRRGCGTGISAPASSARRRRTTSRIYFTAMDNSAARVEPRATAASDGSSRSPTGRPADPCCWARRSRCPASPTSCPA